MSRVTKWQGNSRSFDFAMAHPDLMRLMTWFGLEQMSNIAARSAAFDAKVAAVEAAQAGARVDATFPPSFLLTAILALATAWTTAGPFASLDPEAAGQPARLRENIAKVVGRLVDPAVRK